MAVKVLVVTLLCGSMLARVTSAPALALPRLSEAEWGSYHETDHQGPGTYAFGYDVEDPDTGNTQFRQEERHPNGTVTGSYGLVLPDGSVQVVHYIADNLGYRARVETKPQRARVRHPGVQESRPVFASNRWSQPPPNSRPPAALYGPVYWLPASDPGPFANQV